MQENRESVASLQSKLFPLGKLPFVFNKLSSGTAQSQNNFIISGGEASSVISVVNNATDISRLSCLTKDRPKQSNKRPPTLSFCNSVV